MSGWITRPEKINIFTILRVSRVERLHVDWAILWLNSTSMSVEVTQQVSDGDIKFSSLVSRVNFYTELPRIITFLKLTVRHFLSKTESHCMCTLMRFRKLWAKQMWTNLFGIVIIRSGFTHGMKLKNISFSLHLKECPIFSLPEWINPCDQMVFLFFQMVSKWNVAKWISHITTTNPKES